MDPLESVLPDVEGFIDLDDGVSVHFELYKPSPSLGSSTAGADTSPGGPATAARSPLLLIMGAFATKLHFASTARHIADTCGHEVCIYDHRGVGRSGPAVLQAQTANGLALDALAVVDALWGPDTGIHVYGASMGGMVAQELALLLLPRQRLLSLALAITCRGMQPAYGLLGPLFKPRVLRAFLGAWFRDSKPALVGRLKRLLLSRNVLEARHPCGDSLEQVYSRAWLEQFDELWTFTDPAAGACHAHVVLHHYLSDAQVAALRDCGVPLLAQVASQDRLIPPAMQLQLADLLKARTVTFPTGHMGLLPWKGRFHSMLGEQLAMGEALKGVARAERARSSSGGGGSTRLATPAAGPGAAMEARGASPGSAHVAGWLAGSVGTTAYTAAAAAAQEAWLLDDVSAAAPDMQMVLSDAAANSLAASPGSVGKAGVVEAAGAASSSPVAAAAAAAMQAAAAAVAAGAMSSSKTAASLIA